MVNKSNGEMMNKLILISFLCLFVAACALSPQTVVIDPVVKPGAGLSAKGGTTISLQVRDTRRSTIIGQRGGVYEKTSNLSTDDNMVNTLKKNIGQAFGQLGYSITDSNANAVLTVEIINISYATTVENVVRTVETKAELQAICRKNNQEHTSTYRVTNKKELVKVPSEEKNEELVNAVMTTALERLMSDDELFAFIDN